MDPHSSSDLAQPDLYVVKKKHPLAIRWFHWINFPVIFTMVWSGLLIFWANSSRPGYARVTLFGHPVFPKSFYQPSVPSWWPKWLPHDTETVNNQPKLFLYSLKYRLAEGMYWHFFFFWFFAINGLLYISYLILSGEWRKIVPQKKSLALSIKVVLHDLRILKKEPEKDGIYNHAQRLAYTGIILIGILMIISGVAIYKPTQASWLTALLGGYVMAKWIHFWATMLICAFFVVHVFQVIKTGWANFRSMITGHDIEKVAVTSNSRESEGAA